MRAEKASRMVGFLLSRRNHNPLSKKELRLGKLNAWKCSLSSIINVFHHSSVGSKRGGVTGGRFRRRPFSIVLLPLFSDGNQRRYLKKKGIHYLKLWLRYVILVTRPLRKSHHQFRNIYKKMNTHTQAGYKYVRETLPSSSYINKYLYVCF